MQGPCVVHLTPGNPPPPFLPSLPPHPSLPAAAGFSAWTNAAYGPFVSFMCSFMSWLSGVTDNAIYPGELG